MFHVDNSGKGNCMYYAYSISLMYYLRAKNVPDITDNIFNKLKLKEEDKVQLRTLLSKNPSLAFTTREIKTIIEPILGRATRNLAAEYTKQEFKLYPQDTPLFSAAKYGLEFCFKQSMLANDSDLAELIDHGFTNTNFTEAEIYKMSGTDIGMTEYSLLRVLDVIEEFRRLWAIKVEELKKEEKQFTEREIKEHKEKVLDNVLRAETVRYFLTEDEKNLNLYKQHLQKEYVWGSEETLLVLHRAIQGERMVRNERKTIDTFYDHEMILHIHRSGSSPFTQSGHPVMILNNENNVHWTSSIPDSIFATQLTDTEQKLFEILDELRLMHSKISKEQNKLEYDLLSALMKEIETIQANLTSEMKEQAIEAVFQLSGKLMIKLGSDSTWKLLISNFLHIFIECTPIFLSTKPKLSNLVPNSQEKKQELESKELSSVSSSEKDSSTLKSVEGLSQFSQHTIFKKNDEPIQKTYPKEISLYVSEGKQSGPKVAKAIRQMYSEGLGGDEKYTPEKCREIAQQYISYVTYKNRHYDLTEVKSFIKEMNELIKVKSKQENSQAIDEKTTKSRSLSMM